MAEADLALGGATVRALIDDAALSHPDAVYACATETGAQLTYAELQRGCRGVAARLLAEGLRPGDAISLVMHNGLATLQWLLGAMHGGFVVNPVNLLAQAEQMRYVIEHSDSRLILADADWADKVRALLPGRQLIVIDPDGIDATDRIADEADLPAPAPSSLALLMYTSGTTGQPKGVMLSQHNLAANARSIAAEHALGPEDRVLGVLPLYHINAFAVTMLAPLASRGSVAMAPRFSAARFWAQAAARQCTWLNVVPTIIAILLEGPLPQAGSLQRLRFCRSASAPLPPEQLCAFEQRFGIGVIETMGLTETVAPSFSNPLDPGSRKLGSVGRASGCEARIVDAGLQTLPDGRVGEILVRGPQVTAGYYKNPEATAAALTDDGWLRTGDLGRRDGDGFYFVTGRLKELIIKGGENIAPREIDEVLLAHPAVADAAAVGVPDTKYGQEILACVVLRAALPADAAAADALRADLLRHCEERLGRYKTPRELRFVTELPRGPSGKVQRLKLLEA